MKSLRTRLAITIILVVLGSSVLLSFISYQRAKTSLIQQSEVNYNVAAKKFALELSSWISTNATIIDTLAAEIAVNDVSGEDFESFHRYLKNSNELLNKNGFVYDVYFTYPDNTMVCASDFVPDGTVDFVHEREWYTTSALTGELYYSAPYRDSDTERPIVTISKAVYRDGELLGVLAADIFVDVLVDMIHNADVDNNSYAFLIDQYMRMVVHPDPAYAYEGTPMAVMDHEDTPYRPLLDAIASDSGDLVFVKDYDGVVRGITFARMHNTGWIVGIATDEKELEKGVDSMLGGFIIATLISILIGAFIAIFLARVLDRLNRQEQEYRQQVLKLEKQAADQASEAKSRFLADMSHEIRTPINSVIGMNEMILRETDDPDIRAYSRNIKQSGQNLLQLINGILDFSKIEDGKMEIVPARYDFRGQIDYCMNSVMSRAEAKHLALEFRIDPGIPSELYGDDTRINQAIINLLTNAVKYTEKGSVTLSVSMEEKDTEHNRVRLLYAVADTGIGIRESDMAKLFESFERLDTEKNRNIEGTGLGMNITKKLLDLMGSELMVQSRYGEGSTFSFALWQGIENETPVGEYQKPVENVSGEAYYRESFHAENARILVVDDTEMNLAVIVSLLKKTRIWIDTALSGPDAIRLAEENAYDVILMDQRMPDMDGTETMNRIRALKNRKNMTTPEICLTADVIKGAREKYLRLGFEDYLTKPVSGADLENMLRKYIPKDKITIVTNEPEPDRGEETLDPEMMKALEKVGVDIATGMAFCGNQWSIYESVLDAFRTEFPSKLGKIEESYAAGDWDAYGIYIHSLKSSSKTVGATKLFELAAASEASAKAGNGEEVKARHDTIVRMYKELAEVIGTLRGDEPKPLSNDYFVMEFDPKG